MSLPLIHRGSMVGSFSWYPQQRGFPAGQDQQSHHPKDACSASAQLCAAPPRQVAQHRLGGHRPFSADCAEQVPDPTSQNTRGSLQNGLFIPVFFLPFLALLQLDEIFDSFKAAEYFAHSSKSACTCFPDWHLLWMASEDNLEGLKDLLSGLSFLIDKPQPFTVLWA